jgi:3-hydroxyisobutyrate dehydrogenase-like beta-hydroxyacid dehydrogenase
VLGTGTAGVAIARRLRATGHHVAAWNLPAVARVVA